MGGPAELLIFLTLYFLSQIYVTWCAMVDTGAGPVVADRFIAYHHAEGAGNVFGRRYSLLDVMRRPFYTLIRKHEDGRIDVKVPAAFYCPYCLTFWTQWPLILLAAYVSVPIWVLVYLPFATPYIVGQVLSD